MHKKSVRIMFIFLSAVCMITIFLFSAQNSTSSSESSNYFVDAVVNNIVKDYESLSSENQRSIYHTLCFIVRKSAHFSIYTLLGFLVAGSFSKFKLRSLKSLYAFGICFAYACSDEFHQSFVPGRSCELRDVCIDSSGALTGILIFTLFLILTDKIRKNKAKRNAL